VQVPAIYSHPVDFRHEVVANNDLEGLFHPLPVGVPAQKKVLKKVSSLF